MKSLIFERDVLEAIQAERGACAAIYSAGSILKGNAFWAAMSALTPYYSSNRSIIDQFSEEYSKYIGYVFEDDDAEFINLYRAFHSILLQIGAINRPADLRNP